MSWYFLPLIKIQNDEFFKQKWNSRNFANEYAYRVINMKLSQMGHKMFSKADMAKGFVYHFS